jgi:outer membrane autotransporter protein
VDGSVIYGQSRYTAERNINALGLIAKNSHKGWDASGQIQTGYKISYGDFSVDPFASVGARYSYQNAYQETNANPFNLSISSATTKTATIELGSKFQQSMVVNETMVNPMISLSAYREQPLAKQSMPQ